jgi:hypothetical protein
MGTFSLSSDTAGDLALSRDAQNGRLTGSTLNTVNDSWNYTGFGEAQSYVAAAGTTALYALSFKPGEVATKLFLTPSSLVYLSGLCLRGHVP